MTAVCNRNTMYIKLLPSFIFVLFHLSQQKETSTRLLLPDVDPEFHRLSNLVDQLVKEKNESDRRLGNLELQTSSLTTKMRILETSLSKLQKQMTSTGDRSSYIRWGRTTCPGNGTKLVYAGFAGGSKYSDQGGASNYVCLSGDPLWGHYDDAVGAWAKMYGTEYELVGEPAQATAYFGRNLYNHDAPCAVCSTIRSTSIMIPGRNKCTAGWTEEYHGYLVAGGHTHASATEYICLDERPEEILGGDANLDERLLYMVEGICGTLKCPPYVNGRELTCVVCSK